MNISHKNISKKNSKNHKLIKKISIFCLVSAALFSGYELQKQNSISGYVQNDVAKSTYDSDSNFNVEVFDMKVSGVEVSDMEVSDADNLKLLLESLPKYNGSPYVTVNENHPYFNASNDMTQPFEEYSELDSLGRCGTAFANIGKEIMPSEERGKIGAIRPSGWHTVKYDFVDGKYLYNRCHLIGYQLAGENANEKNLITGTRYFNVQGMLPFENMVESYVRETNHHVLYRVTPVFEGENLLAEGVLMEAWSVEDEGREVCFNVFVYNVEPGVVIDYVTGDSRMDEEYETIENGVEYILNTNTKKFHHTNCSAVGSMSEKNKLAYTGTRDEVIAQGYVPCKNCNP